ncbi:MAG: hypothetical protein QXP70_02895 [Methanomassiliicoccales archaeon]
MREVLPGVFLIDRYSLKSFGNCGYLIQHEKGNILVDAPELSQEDADAIKQKGGISKIFITHIRAFGDACNIKSKFGASLVIHEEDAKLIKGCTADTTFNSETPLYDDVLIIPTTGYTKGSSSLLVKRNEGMLFCGDLFWWGNRDRYSSELMSWPTEEDKKTWFLSDDIVINTNLLDSNPDEMMASAKKLLSYDFEAVLMSHPNYPPRARGIVKTGGKEMIRRSIEINKTTQFTLWQRK